MRIFQIDDNEKIFGGGGLVKDRTARLIEKRGFDVFSYSAEKQFKPRKSYQVLDYLFSWKYFSRLKKKLLEQKPDVVHIHTYCSQGPVVLLAVKQAQKKLGFKVIMTTHGHGLLCPTGDRSRYSKGKIERCSCCKGKSCYKVFTKCCDRRGIIMSFLCFLRHFLFYNILKVEKSVDVFIAPSDYMKKRLSKRVEKEKIKTIYNPIFLTEEQIDQIKLKATKKKSEFESVYIGRITPEKGLQKFLEEDYNKEKFGKLAIIGSGEKSYINELKAFCKKKKVDSFIHFLGEKSHEESMLHLAKSKRLIFPSICYETFGLVALEAKVFGKEIFHYDLPTVYEILKKDLSEYDQEKYVDSLERLYVEATEKN